MKKQDYSQLKKTFEKNYPVFIAFCSSILAFFSFFLQFKDLLSGWNVIIVAVIIFLASVIISWFFAKTLYTIFQKQSVNREKTLYDIIESIDICEFTTNDLAVAKYTRVEKIRINSKEPTQVTYKLPVVNSPGSIENIHCSINSKKVNYSYQKRYGENLYGYYLNPKEFDEIIEVVWNFDILNSFSIEDNIRVRSYRSIETLKIKVLFNNFNQKVFSEAYKMYGNEDAAFSKEELGYQTTTKQIIIEKDFSTQLDGGIYRFGIQWKFYED